MAHVWPMHVVFEIPHTTAIMRYVIPVGIAHEFTTIHGQFVANFVQFGGMFGADWPTTRPEFGAVFVANLSRNLPRIQGGFLGKFKANVLRCQSKQPIGPWAPVAPAVAS